MLSLLGRDPGRNDDEAGFTLIEIAVVVLIFSIVLVIAAGALNSLNNTANRNEAQIAEDQAASGAIAQLSRDIRSANAISFPGGDGSQTKEIQIAVNKPSGGTVQVLWVYDTTRATLTREVSSGGSFVTSGSPVQHVANPSGTALFSYVDKAGAPISSNTAADIATCATGINLDLYVGSKIQGSATIEETAEVALTNRLNVLTAPGNGQCVTSS